MRPAPTREQWALEVLADRVRRLEAARRVIQAEMRRIEKQRAQEEKPCAQ